MIIAATDMVGIFSRNMIRLTALYLIFYFGIPGLLPAQRGVDPASRYFRVICLVHLTGSGKADSPIVHEFVTQGTEIAKNALAAATPTSGTQPMRPPAHPATAAATSELGAKPAENSAKLSSRPGFIAWSMQLTDDGKMAIVHIVAAAPTAFAPILADRRPEIRVFQIGKDTKST